MNNVYEMIPIQTEPAVQDSQAQTPVQVEMPMDDQRMMIAPYPCNNRKMMYQYKKRRQDTGFLISVFWLLVVIYLFMLILGKR